MAARVSATERMGTLASQSARRRHTMKKNSLLLSIAMLILLALSLPSPAAAKDAVQAAVPDPLAHPGLFSGHVPVAVMNNGNPLSNGTFAVGTIQLFYEIDKTELGTTNTFPLALSIKQGPTTGQQTAYPVD